MERPDQVNLHARSICDGMLGGLCSAIAGAGGDDACSDPFFSYASRMKNVMAREFEELKVERWVSEEDQLKVVQWTRVFNEITNALGLPRVHVAYVAERQAQRWALADGSEILCVDGAEPSSAIRCGVEVQKLVVLKVVLPTSGRSSALTPIVLARVKSTFLDFNLIGPASNVKTVGVQNFIARLAHFARPVLMASAHLAPHEVISIPQTLRDVYEGFSRTLLTASDEADAVAVASWAAQALEPGNPKHLKYLKALSAQTVRFSPTDCEDAKLLGGLYLGYLKAKHGGLQR